MKFVVTTIPYLLFFTALFFLSFFKQVNYCKIQIKNRYIYSDDVFVFLLCLFFIGCRGYVYTDCHTYKLIFELSPKIWSGIKALKTYNTLSWGGNWELGFLIYVAIIKSFVNSYLIFQLINFLIDFYLLWKISYYFLETTSFRLFIFFYLLFGGIPFEFNTFRNVKAVLIYLYATKYIYNKNFIKYSCCIIFASFFHVSALLYLPLYFILNKKWSLNRIIFLFFVGNFIYLMHIRYIYYLCIQIAKNFNLLKLYRLADYFSYTTHFTVFGFTERTITFILVLTIVKTLREKQYGNLIVNSYFLYSFCYLFLSESTQFAERMSNLFSYSYWIIYPFFWNKLKRNEKSIFLILIFLYGLLKFYSMNAQPDSIFVIYKNFLISGLNMLEY